MPRAATRTSRTFRSNGPRRKRVWARNTLTFNNVVGGTAQALDPLGAFMLQAGMSTPPMGTTVSRFRMGLGITRDVGVALNPAVTGGLLVGPTTLDADDIDPAANFHLDWMWWSRLPLRNDAAAFQTIYEVDVKSMRKMEELGERLFLVFNTAGGDTVDIVAGTSTLLLFP